MNSVTELGPPLVATAGAADDLAAIDKRVHTCPDAVEASVSATATCPKCGWTPDDTAPTAEVAKLKQLVSTGLTDRFQRFKDATIGSILQKAAESDGRADLKSLLKVIQLSKMDSLA